MILVHGLPKHYDVEWECVLAGTVICGFDWVLEVFFKSLFHL